VYTVREDLQRSSTIRCLMWVSANWQADIDSKSAGSLSSKIKTGFLENQTSNVAIHPGTRGEPGFRRCGMTV
jgi:hypothetical protein